MSENGHVFQPRSKVFLDHVLKNALLEAEAIVPVIETIAMERLQLLGGVIQTEEQKELALRVIREFDSLIHQLDLEIAMFMTRDR